jgi:hypothetical protein
VSFNKSCAISSVTISCTLWGALMVLGFAILGSLDDSYGWSFWLREHVPHWIFVTLAVIANAWMFSTWVRFFYRDCNRRSVSHG